MTRMILSQCVCGIFWALFSGQPLLIMSATGPMLVFESALYAVSNCSAISDTTSASRLVLWEPLAELLYYSTHCWRLAAADFGDIRCFQRH